MSEKFKILNKRITREYLANPFADIPYEERLEKAGAIDLRDNCIITELPNGYSKIEPIDKNKLFKGNKTNII